MVEIDGMKELKKSFKKLEILPQKVVNKSVRKAILLPKNAAKKGGWIDKTGNLRKGIKTKAEKTRIKGKKVYQVAMDAKMNDVFVKMSKDGKKDTIILLHRSMDLSQENLVMYQGFIS